MKIEINIDDTLTDTNITVSCKRITPEIEKLISTLRMLDHQLTAVKDGATHIIDISKIIYIESVDRKTFIYTDENVYESNLRLYELEQQLEDYGFFRASKSCLAQIKLIKSLKTDIDRRIRVTMENGEQIIVSRQYADGLRSKLGL